MREYPKYNQIIFNMSDSKDCKLSDGVSVANVSNEIPNHRSCDETRLKKDHENS